MPPYTGLSGGAGAAYQLQDILTRRKDEARQAMLDELNRREVESNIGYRNSMTSLAQAREEREQGKYYQEVADALFGAGENLPDNVDPKLMEWMQSHGLVDMQAPRVSTSEAVADPEEGSPLTPESFAAGQKAGIAPSPHAVYLGTRGARQELERKAALDAYASSPNTSDEGRNYAMLARAGVQNIPGQAIQGMHNINIFDEPSGTIRQSPVRVPGYQTVTRSYPPIGPVESWQSVLVNPKGNIVQTSNRGRVQEVSPPGGAVTRIPTPGSGGGAGGANSKIAPADLTAMRLAQTPEQLWAAQSNIITRYLPSDETKEFARQILGYKDKDKHSVEELMGMTSRPLTPQESESLHDVLNAVLGRSKAPEPSMWQSLLP